MFDLSIKLYDLDGQPLSLVPPTRPGEKVEPMTAGTVCYKMLGLDYQGETLTFDQKLDRNILARRIKDRPMLELTADEVALLKTLVGKLNPDFVGAIGAILDPVAFERAEKRAGA